MPFNASTFLTPYLHQSSAMVQIVPFFGAICIESALDLLLILHQNLEKLQTKRQNGAIEDAFIDNISTKA